MSTPWKHFKKYKNVQHILSLNTLTNCIYYTSLTSHWLKLNHMTWNNFNVLWKLTQTGNNPIVPQKGNKPTISNILNRFKMCVFKITSKIASCQYNLPWAIMTNLGQITGPLWKHPFLNTFINQSISISGNLHSFWRRQ